MAFARVLTLLMVLVTALTPVVFMTSFNTDDETFLLEKGHRGGQTRSLNLTDVGAKERERTLTFAGIAYCPHAINLTKLRTESTDDALPLISTCPWYWTLNFDPKRDPSTILSAKCSCSACMKTTTPTTSDQGRCVPVNYFRDVTYNVTTDMKSGRWKLVPKVYRVAVGCVCERDAAKPTKKPEPGSH